MPNDPRPMLRERELICVSRWANATLNRYHETGIPAHPRTTLIDGRLVLSRKVVGRAPVLQSAE